MFYHDGSTIPNAPYKDPDEVVDYGCDWSGLLQEDESITSSSWDISVGLTGSSETNASPITGVMLSGGEVGQTYTVTNRVTTTLGRSYDRSMLILCQDK